MINKIKDLYAEAINPKNKSQFRKETDRRNSIWVFNTEVEDVFQTLHNAKIKAEIKASDIERRYKALLHSLKEDIK